MDNENSFSPRLVTHSQTNVLVPEIVPSSQEQFQDIMGGRGATWRIARSFGHIFLDEGVVNLVKYT